MLDSLLGFIRSGQPVQRSIGRVRIRELRGTPALLLEANLNSRYHRERAESRQ